MKSVTIGVFATTVLLLAGATQPGADPAATAVQKGIQWLVSVQGKDGGWGQDGGETSYIRVTEHLESTGNDVANTAVAALALLHAGNTPTKGPYRASVQRAMEFLLRNVDQSPEQGIAVTKVTGTQIQRKLGPYIDTFLTSMLLAELDGNTGDPNSNARVRLALQKCVDKIEKNQLKDGSWNIAGGWAPVLGTSMASRSLFVAQQKGARVETAVVDRAAVYAKQQAGVGSGVGAGVGGGVGRGSGGGVGSGTYAAGRGDSATLAIPSAGLAASAGVPLYQSAQVLEQLSRTAADRRDNDREIKTITKQLNSPAFVRGFGSMGGEEFYSYLNVSDSLHRVGGEDWNKWNGQMKTQLTTLQNDDGSWAGQHCITGRVAVTSAAILTMLVERDPVVPAAAKLTKTSK